MNKRYDTKRIRDSKIRHNETCEKGKKEDRLHAKKAVVLLSGGLDSTTALAIANEQGYEIYALSFDYGQRHIKELKCARAIAKHYHVAEHKILKIDLSAIGGSALTDKKIKVPTGRNLKKISKEIPITYVPARNTILLSFALSWAEVIGADAIFIGANALDYSGYPDCRPEFYKAFEEVARLGTKRGIEGKTIKLEYPLINMTKAEIIKEGIRLGVPYELTWSCYKGGKYACGKCDSCLLRLKGFREAGSRDRIAYKPEK